MSLFQREPARVLGYIGTVLVVVFAKWRGLSYEEAAVTLAGLVATVEGIRAKVTPYAEGAVDRYRELRGDVGRDDLHNDGSL